MNYLKKYKKHFEICLFILMFFFDGIMFTMLIPQFIEKRDIIYPNNKMPLSPFGLFIYGFLFCSTIIILGFIITVKEWKTDANISK